MSAEEWVADALAHAGVFNAEASALDVLVYFKAKRIELVELPKAPSEYWGPNHYPQWNHYPYTRVDGDEIEIGARCEHVFRINTLEAQVFAADVLAAAVAADGSTGGEDVVKL